MANTASRKMLNIVEQARSSAWQAERDYDTGAAQIQRMSERSISLFGGDAVNRVADIASESRKICDELYAAYQTLVEIVDDQCRPLLDENPELEAVEAVCELIKWLNDESEIENNFTASFNGNDLGGIASSRYIPMMKNKMIERFWASKYDMWPGRAEKEAAEKKENKAAAERTRQEAKLLRKAIEEEYEKNLALWKTEVQRIEILRRKKLEQALGDAKKRRIKEIDDTFSSITQRVDTVIYLSEQKRSDASQKLETLGFFKFAEKQAVQKTIDAMTTAITEAERERADAEERHSKEKREVDKWLQQQEKKLRMEVERTNPMPIAPQKPYFTANGQKIDLSGIKGAIVYGMTPGKHYTLSDLCQSIPELMDSTPQIVNSMLRSLVLEGLVKRIEDKRKAYYTLAD